MDVDDEGTWAQFTFDREPNLRRAARNLGLTAQPLDQPLGIGATPHQVVPLTVPARRTSTAPPGPGRVSDYRVPHHTPAPTSLDTKQHVQHDGVRLTTKAASDVRVQQVVFAPGGSNGWRHHPGLVMVMVASGTETLWDENCNKTDYGPGVPNGAVFIETGDEPGQVTSTNGAVNYTTYIVPKATPAVFRIEDTPPPCAQ